MGSSREGVSESGFRFLAWASEWTLFSFIEIINRRADLAEEWKIGSLFSVLSLKYWQQVVICKWTMNIWI